MTAAGSPALSPGNVIIGLKKRSQYRIDRKLGEGANGQVYLATGGRSSGKCAVKIGNPDTDLLSEIALLRKVSPKTLHDRPFFAEADVYADRGEQRPFYVMAYIQGSSLSAFIDQRGEHWLYLTGYYLLRKLAVIHGKGYAFGDLKASNIVVSPEGKIDLIDYGGAAPFGRAVRQFTEIYDREYWNCGTRSADSGYDLFSFALLFMQLAGAALPGRGDVQMLPQHRTLSELLQAVDDNPVCRPVAPVVKAMIEGRYRDSRKAMEDWHARIGRIGIVPAPEVRFSWLETFLIAALLLFAIFVYLFIH